MEVAAGLHEQGSRDLLLDLLMIVSVDEQVDALNVLQQGTAVVQLAIGVVANVADAHH